MTVELYEVGGCVRDELLGVRTKDIDYTAVVNGLSGQTPPYEYLDKWLTDKGFTIFKRDPQFLTIRAHFPAGWNFADRDCSKLTADFVLARKEGAYFDGRHPESVIPGTLEDDLRRRDFTVNAMAKDFSGHIIDLFDGMGDLQRKLIRAVGEPSERLNEDALRALRAIRFAVTRGFAIEESLWNALLQPSVVSKLAVLPVERKYEELHKCFKKNTFLTLKILDLLGDSFMTAAFAGGLWLEPTLKG